MARREPSVRNCIGLVDGVSVPAQCCSEVTAQNAAYNGYRHDTNVNNVLAFSPTGMVMYAAINYPGSWHDSTVSAGLIELFIELAYVWTRDFQEVGLYSRNLLDQFQKKRRKSSNLCYAISSWLNLLYLLL